MTISRRDLFGWLRGATPPVPDDEATPPGFSLDTFYATRSTERALPAFALRATTATPTTRIGSGRTDAAAAPTERAEEVTAIAPDLVPQILPHRCLATSSFCSVCVERCPIAGAIVVELGRPRVDPARCDGCGRCIATCPAPILAFALVPRAPR